MYSLNYDCICCMRNKHARFQFGNIVIKRGSHSSEAVIQARQSFKQGSHSSKAEIGV